MMPDLEPLPSWKQCLAVLFLALVWSTFCAWLENPYRDAIHRMHYHVFEPETQAVVEDAVDILSGRVTPTPAPWPWDYLP